MRGPSRLMLQSPTDSAGGNLLYVTDVEDQLVHVFNAVDGNHLRTIGQGEGDGPGQLKCPLGCVASSVATEQENSGELYVSEWANHRISVFDISTGDFKRHIGSGQGSKAGQLRHPTGLALKSGCVDKHNGDDLLYVAENERVQVFNARTGAHVGNVGRRVLTRPVGVALQPATHSRCLLLVCEEDGLNNRIKVFEV